METDYDALVIGAGPAGSSAAILLARSGWRVALIEKHAFPRRKVCGECIAASNLPLLDALGIGHAFAELAGPPLRHVALMVGDRTIRAGFPPHAHPRHRWGVALSRAHLDTLLLEQAQRCGVTLFQPWAARGIDGGPGRFSCEIARPQSDDSMTLNAPLLIDAHGSWEALPSGPAQQQPPHRASDLFAFKANFTGANLEHGLLPVLSFPGGYGGLVVGDHATATFAFCIRRDRLASCRKALPGRKAADAAAAYVADTCVGVRVMLSGARQQGAWLSAGPIRPGIRIEPGNRVGGHAFLIGNAAGEAHPIIGEGISMAIQSAWLLAEQLAPHRGQVADAHLQTLLRQRHAQAWRRHFAPRIRLAALFAQLAMRPAAAAWALPLLHRYPQLLTHAARWSGKIRCAPFEEPAAGRLPDIDNRPA